MKRLTLSFDSRRHQPPNWARPVCSAAVLAGIGLLLAPALLPAAHAQGAGGTLAAGTLPVIRGVVSGTLRTSTPQVTPINGGAGRSLMIDQVSNRAVLDWQSFNIANGSEVVFNHPSTASSTLNRIYSADPSVIQGRLTTRLWNGDIDRPEYSTKPGGQVLLINQNGILFDRGAQVDTGALIASTLNLSNDKFVSGLITSTTEAAFAGGYDDLGNTLPSRPDGTRPATIGVGSFGPAGYQAPQLTAASGGSIMLFAPRIDNDSGVIASPDGQVILAAGRKVWLSQNPDSNDITLRGLVVEVEADTEGVGLNLSNLIRNAGHISAERGNVSIAALAVNQEGRISATTAVQSNGSIYLKAASRQSSTLAGTVNLARGSVTEVVPDSDTEATLTEAQDYTPFRGVVDVSAADIVSYGTLSAPGGRVNIRALDPAGGGEARLYLGAGSVTSVAGTWADVGLEKNFATFRITSNELKNAPDQKNGVLRGASVTVDLRQDSSVLALDAYRAAVARTVAEKTARGGELSLQSAGELILREGGTVDVSGGGYRHAGGTASTSQLLGADGKIYDLATAPQANTYVGLLDSFVRNDERYNQSVTWANPLGRVTVAQQPYAEGKAAGTLSLGSATGLVLDGLLKGGVTIGPRQLARAPAAGSLIIGKGVEGSSYNSGQLIGSLEWKQAPSDTLGASFSANSALEPSRRNSFALAASQVFGASSMQADGLVETAFGSVQVNSNGRITLPESVEIESQAGAGLVFRAPAIDLAGDIRLPAGSLTLAPLIGGVTTVSPELATLSERTIVRGTSTLSVAGDWVNYALTDGALLGLPRPAARLGSDGSTLRSSIDGGSLQIVLAESRFQTRLARGAVLDVGGGALMDAGRRVTGGKGGVLALANGALGQATSDWLQADLRGFAASNGGALVIGLNRAVLDGDAANGLLPADSTRLTSRLFDSSGFSRVTVNAFDGIDIADGFSFQARQQNLVLRPADLAALPAGADVQLAGMIETLPDWQRQPLSITLGSGSTLTMAEQASIRTDPRGSVALTAVDGLSVNGDILAPGGNISLSLQGRDSLQTPALRLGAKAELSVAGVFVPAPSDRGLTQGTVVNGGAVTITARQTGVQLDAGSRIDVSAVSQTVQQAISGAAGAVVEQPLEGHAGTLTVRTQGASSLGATLAGSGGSAAAAGASFALEYFRPDRQSQLPAPRRIVVGPGLPDDGSEDLNIDLPALQASGFEKLRLQSENTIAFAGSGSYSFARGVRLDAPNLALADGASVALSGARVSLGQASGPRLEESTDAGTVWTLDSARPFAERQPRVGTASLSVDAGFIDLFGTLNLDGVQTLNLKSDSDLQLIGRPTGTGDPGGQSTRQIGFLRSAGDVSITASQVYPATRTEYLLEAGAGASATGSYVLIRGNGKDAGDIYSAAGQLEVKAATIIQSGAVKAPMGNIALNASQLLELGAGSTTSVSGDGRTTLYGTTQSGVVWQYADGGSSGDTPVTSVLAGGKSISLSASRIDVLPGAAVDVRGGGDVMAVEFVPGNGGDSDKTVQANTYAIVPKSRLQAMPYDSHLLTASGERDPGFGFSFANGRDAALYDSIDIGPGGAVPAGEYALLPARYALLPDAYLVQLQTGSAYANLQPGQVSRLANGEVVVPAHRVAASSTVRESATIGVTLLPGSEVRRYSDYTISGATLFADQATDNRTALPVAPWDAGRIGFSGAAQLTLAGDFLTDPDQAGVYSGRTAQIDIAGSRIAIVDTVGASTANAGFLELAGAALSNLGGSVLIGGRREDTDSGTRLVTGAEDIRVANSAAGAVRLPEVLFAARQRIDFGATSVIEASAGQTAGSAGSISTEGSGVFVRLSNGQQTTLDRASSAVFAGDLSIAAGATLNSARSLMLDARGTLQSQGSISAGAASGQGGSVVLGAGRIVAGDGAQAGAAALVLTSNDLARFAALDELVLRGYESISLGGALSFGSSALGALTLDTPLLRSSSNGGATADAAVSAGLLTLKNSSGGSGAPAAGSGTLVANATTLTLGAGDKQLAGFGSVSLVGSERIATEGIGSLTVVGNLDLSSPLVQAGSGSNQRITALADGVGTGVLTAGRPAAALAGTTVAGASALGGRLTLVGERVQVSTTVQAPSGFIGAVATGGAGLALGATGKLDVSGKVKRFNGTLVAAGGGQVSLQAANGNVDLQAGSIIDVGAAPEGGAAGRLTVQAKSLNTAATLAGSSIDPAKGGSASFDLDALGAAGGGFSALNSALNAGGFSLERSVRLRSGDILVGAADSVAAADVRLSADQGRIDVLGSLGKSGVDRGAQVQVFGANGVALGEGSRVLASAAAVGARGGEVRIAVGRGELEFAASSEIDVRAGPSGPTGSVIFGTARDGAGQVGATKLAGLVKTGATATTPGASVDLEATRTYAAAEVGTAIGSSQIEAWATEHAAFMGAAAGLKASLLGSLRDENGSLASARLLGATEIRAAGDLSIDSNWDLTTQQWRSGDLPGTLTVRAAGQITLHDALGGARVPDNTQDQNHMILAGDTWNIRLAAGADLGAAAPLATSAEAMVSGHLLLTGANASVRTGTGRIDLAAAGDLRIDNAAASIYTGGRIGAADAEASGNNRWAVDGGGISIRAGGDITGAPGGTDLWITDWLRRPRMIGNLFTSRGFPTDWWAYRPRFQNAVGTLAGGDIDIRAGGDIDSLSVMSPTTGRTFSDAAGARAIEITGGGDINMRAAGDINGAGYLIGRGAGTLEAGGAIGASGPAQLYLMGASSGNAPEGARIDLIAGTSVALQSIDNPTVLRIIDSSGAAGPSFNVSRASTFYTYSSNSAAGLFAKGGDITYADSMSAATTWRTFGASFNTTFRPSSVAYPASLAMVAFGGDIRGPGVDTITTYPSDAATMVAFAGKSLFDFAIDMSDLGADAIVTPFRNFEKALPTATASSDPGRDISTFGVPKNVQAGRITLREPSLPYGTSGRDEGTASYFADLQAADGSIVYTQNFPLFLPAVSRIQAGIDILQPALTLQNLEPTDTSVVRADAGDVRRTNSGGGFEVRGPGRLLVQAGRNVDLGQSLISVAGSSTGLGGLVASGNSSNPRLPTTDSARVTVLAGVKGSIDLTRLDAVYEQLIVLNSASADILDLYQQFSADTGREEILAAAKIADLAVRNAGYSRFVKLDAEAPQALKAYQLALAENSLPLGPTADGTAATRLYALLNQQADVAALTGAGSVEALAQSAGGQAYSGYVDLSRRYPRLFADYVQRRSKGALPTGINPIVFSDSLKAVVAQVIPEQAVAEGDIRSFQSSIQTYAASGIDLLAPGGDIIVGLTTPGQASIGVLTNAGGAIRSIVGGDFNINQGKVITAQGGDILIFSAQGSIDAGRGAKTSQSTPAPVRRPVFDQDGNQIGVLIVISSAATGSGIQTLSSDVDGPGPAVAPQAGDVFLFAPAGVIDAGEAGIRSSGNIVLNAQTVLNASDIKAAGTAQGVSQLQLGSLAAAIAAGGAQPAQDKSEEVSKKIADQARQAAAAPPPPKPTVLTVEVLGFGDKNCKEDDKECFAK